MLSFDHRHDPWFHYWISCNKINRLKPQLRVFLDAFCYCEAKKQRRQQTSTAQQKLVVHLKGGMERMERDLLRSIAAAAAA